MRNDDPWLGKAGLWIACIGSILPLCLVVLFFVLARTARFWQMLGWAVQSPGCGVTILVSLQIVAMGCGFAATRTATGKFLMVVSGLWLLLVSGLIAYIFIFLGEE